MPPLTATPAQRIGRAINRKRNDAGLSVVELAARVGTSHTTIYRLEAGGRGRAPRGPQMSTLRRIADELGTTVAELTS